MGPIDYVVRDSASNLVRGQVDQSVSTIPVDPNTQLSLNLSPGDVASYRQEGTNLVIELVDGRTIVVDGYFAAGATGADAVELYLSENGLLSAVGICQGDTGGLVPEYRETAIWAKWSPDDDLIFLGAAAAPEEVTRGLPLGLLGGLAGAPLGLLGGLGAAGVGAAALLDDDDDGGNSADPADPTDPGDGNPPDNGSGTGGDTPGNGGGDTPGDGTGDGSGDTPSDGSGTLDPGSETPPDTGGGGTPTEPSEPADPGDGAGQPGGGGATPTAGSYTHLTLTTISSGEITGGAAYSTKKTIST